MKNIVITGASRGVGYALSKKLTESGCRVFAISRNKERLEKLRNECSDGHLFPLVGDITDASFLDEVAEKLKDQATHISGLVNNAGAMLNKPFEKISRKEILYLYKVNVFAAMELIQKCIPMMGKAGKSHVLNIGSMGGFQGSVKFPGLSIYSSSKSALAGFTECLAEEYRNTSIYFNCLAFGAVQTEMLEEAFPGYQAPLSADEMAIYVQDFLLADVQYFNGKVIPVSLSTP